MTLPSRMQPRCVFVLFDHIRNERSYSHDLGATSLPNPRQHEVVSISLQSLLNSGINTKRSRSTGKEPFHHCHATGEDEHEFAKKRMTRCNAEICLALRRVIGIVVGQESRRTYSALGLIPAKSKLITFSPLITAADFSGRYITGGGTGLDSSVESSSMTILTLLMPTGAPLTPPV